MFSRMLLAQQGKARRIFQKGRQRFTKKSKIMIDGQKKERQTKEEKRIHDLRRKS